MSYETAARNRYTKQRLTMHDSEAVRHLYGGKITRRALLYATADDWQSRVAHTGQHYFNGPLKRKREVR